MPKPKKDIQEKAITEKDSNIKYCSCKHAYQDEKFGEGKRVHNPLAKAKDEKQKWCCTICGAKK